MKRNHYSHLPQPPPDHLESCAAACPGFWNPGLFRAHEPETMSFEAAVWAGGLAASGEQSMNEGSGPDTRGRQHSGGEQRGFFPVTVRGHKTLIQVTVGTSLAHTWRVEFSFSLKKGWERHMRSELSTSCVFPLPRNVRRDL